MFKTTVTPRFGDIDGLGHINNTVLPVWFELGRNPFFRMFEPNLNLSHDTWRLILARIEFDFIHQMVFKYDVEIRSYITHIGNKSFTIGHEAWQNGNLCVKGQAVLVHFDFQQQQTTPIPDDIKAQLAEHLNK